MTHKRMFCYLKFPCHRKKNFPTCENGETVHRRAATLRHLLRKQRPQCGRERQRVDLESVMRRKTRWQRTPQRGAYHTQTLVNLAFLIASMHRIV